MKLKTIALATILALQTVQVFGATISSSKSWSAARESQHWAWNEPSCRAATLSSNKKSVLEVYAERRNGVYTEPTVQFVTKYSAYPVKFYKVKLVITSKGQNYTKYLSLVNRPGQNPDQRVAIAKLGDREQLVNLLKAGSSVKATFYGSKNNGILFREQTFSLSGSSATINNMMSACNTKFNTIDL
jgi:hypothetical protein